MSCYDWEEGTIKIPSDEWRSFKTKILDVANKITERDYKLALKLYLRVREEGKNIRAFNYKSALRLAMNENNLTYDSSLKIESAMFPWQVERTKPLKPKKKNFKMATNRTEILNVNGEAEIIFNNTMKTVSWHVVENNRAVEEARDHPLSRALFLALESVDWKRNSGGVIIGNDEHNQDTTCPGGGANYITTAYGPIGLKRKKSMR